MDDRRHAQRLYAYGQYLGVQLDAHVSGRVFRPGGWSSRRERHYIVPSGTIQYRDLNGGVHTFSVTTVTITNLPILLENMPTFSKALLPPNREWRAPRTRIAAHSHLVSLYPKVRRDRRIRREVSQTARSAGVAYRATFTGWSIQLVEHFETIFFRCAPSDQLLRDFLSYSL